MLRSRQRSAGTVLPVTSARMVTEGVAVLTLEEGDRRRSYLVTELPGAIGVYEDVALSTRQLRSDRPGVAVTAAGCSCGERPCRHLDVAFLARRCGIGARNRADNVAPAALPLSPGRIAARVFALAAGDVWGWGRLFADTAVVQTALPIRLTKDWDFVAIAETKLGFLALDRHGSVFLWEERGVLATRPALATPFVPTKVAGLPPIARIAAGCHHSLALDRHGRVWAWGKNDRAQCGVDLRRVPVVREPRPVPGLEGIVDVVAGIASSYARREDGVVFAWGDNASFQTGTGSPGSSLIQPLPVDGLRDVVALATGSQFALALRKDGAVFGWGNNRSRVVSSENVPETSLAKPLRWLRDVRAIAAGSTHALALRHDGKVVAWGSNRFGQLGIPRSRELRHQPVVVPDVEGVVAIAAGDRTSFAIRVDGAVLVWGENSFGIAGTGQESPVWPPTVVPGLRLPVATAADVAARPP